MNILKTIALYFKGVHCIVCGFCPTKFKKKYLQLNTKFLQNEGKRNEEICLFKL